MLRARDTMVHRPTMLRARDTTTTTRSTQSLGDFSFSAIRNHFTLVLGNGRENVKRQACSVRVVYRDELHAGIHQGRDERQIS